MVVAFVGCCNPVGEPNGTVGFLFTKQEIPTYSKTLKNKPIYLNHKHDLGPVGRIAKSWVENGKMMVAGVIHTKSLPAKIAGAGVLQGILKGLSLGTIHGVLKNNSGKCTDILWREIVDVTVCAEGDLPGTHILTMAAKQAEEVETVYPTKDFSPYDFFYSDASNDKELPDILTKERTLRDIISTAASGKNLNPSQAYNSEQQQSTFRMSTESGSQQPPQGNFGEKRSREMPPPPNIPAGLRAFAQRPTQAQQTMIDPMAQAKNEALRQQQAAVPGQPPAKKARTELTPAQTKAAADEEKKNSEAEEEAGKNQEPVPLDRKEYVELLKAKAEKEDQAKKMLEMEAKIKALQEKNQGWQAAAALSLGNNADSASLRAQYNLENEERAKAAQIKVKEALKTGKEVKKLLQSAGRTPSAGLTDGLQRLDTYNKDPRQLLHKKCRDDVLNLTGWLSDYNQARMLTVASNNKATAQLEAELQTTQARYKTLEEKRELKKIANGAQYSSTTTTTSSMIPSNGFRGTPTRTPMKTNYQQPKIPVPNQQQFQDYPPQDCWASAHSFQPQTQKVLTTASSTSGNAEERYSSFYSKSSTPMSVIDPGPPMQRPPSNINFTPFDTFYRAPVSHQTSQYGAQLKQHLSIGTGQGRFSVPGFCGKDYGNSVNDLPKKWRSDDQYTFGMGRPYTM